MPLASENFLTPNVLKVYFFHAANVLHYTRNFENFQSLKFVKSSKSMLKVYFSEVLEKYTSFLFQLLGECHCWWTSESPRAHVAKFYGRLRLIRSVWRASKLSVFKINGNCYLFWHFLVITFQLFQLHCFDKDH